MSIGGKERDSVSVAVGEEWRKTGWGGIGRVSESNGRLVAAAMGQGCR